jgi:hypothetical protein
MIKIERIKGLEEIDDPTEEVTDEPIADSEEAEANSEADQIEAIIDLEQTEPEPTQNIDAAVLMLSLFQIADQVKILHLQTAFKAEHLAFGLFYDTFTELMDTLIEAIAGKYGTDKLKFNEASIIVYDYSAAKPVFFDLVDEILRVKFSSIFNRDKDSELFNIIDEMLDLKNKVQYLLQMK